MDDASEPAVDLPFGDTVYISALLGPSFCLFWQQQDVRAPDEVNNEVKEMIIGKFTHHFQTNITYYIQHMTFYA